MKEILAPLDGKVIGISDKKGIVTVYVAPEDSHKIYSPVSGKVVRFEEHYGEWIRPGYFMVPDQKKTGRLKVYFYDAKCREMIMLLVEVGHGKYITDTIRIDKMVGDKVQAGELIGEIIIGSLYEMRMGEKSKILVKLGDKVVGQKTILGIFR
jgi:phosphatidylserine decarboxylase